MQMVTRQNFKKISLLLIETKMEVSTYNNKGVNNHFGGSISPYVG